MLSENQESDTDTSEENQNVFSLNLEKLSNIKDSVIVDACDDLLGIDDQRAELNAKANAIRATLKNLGIPTQAFNAAYARYKLDEDKRRQMDVAFAKCANAMGVGYQNDLFKH